MAASATGSGSAGTFLVGMSGFVAASALAGLAVDPALLVGARLLQGAFGALLIPQGMAIMTRTFPREALTKAFGAFGPLLGLFAVGGPVLAGFLIDADLLGLGWRPVFLINVVVGGAGCCSPPERSRTSSPTRRCASTGPQPLCSPARCSACSTA